MGRGGEEMGGKAKARFRLCSKELGWISDVCQGVGRGVTVL